MRLHINRSIYLYNEAIPKNTAPFSVCAVVSMYLSTAAATATATVRTIQLCWQRRAAKTQSLRTLALYKHTVAELNILQYPQKCSFLLLLWRFHLVFPSTFAIRFRYSSIFRHMLYVFALIIHHYYTLNLFTLFIYTIEDRNSDNILTYLELLLLSEHLKKKAPKSFFVVNVEEQFFSSPLTTTYFC